MKIKFIGVGGAFAPISVGNSDMLLTADNGNRMLIDCGTSAPYILRDEMGIQHYDFLRYFIPRIDSDGV